MTLPYNKFDKSSTSARWLSDKAWQWKLDVVQKTWKMDVVQKTLKLVGVQKNAKWILSKKNLETGCWQKLKYETRCFPKKTEKIDVFQKLKTRYFPKNLINWRLPKTENLMFSKKMKTGCSPKKRKLDVFQKILKTGWCPIKMQSGCCQK